ncbi:hypothetical protein D3C72_1898980 [compost metagenome]
MKTRVQNPRNHRHRTRHGVHCQLAHADAFRAGQRAIFTGPAQRHDAVDALLEQIGNQRLRGRDVDGVIGIDGGRDSGKDAAKLGCVQHIANPKG